MDKPKNFNVLFYRAHLGNDDTSGQTFLDHFNSICISNEILLNKNKTASVELISDEDEYLFCALRIYRDDAPHVGSPDGEEREIDMSSDESVIEKTFIYYSKVYKLFALQTSSAFRSPAYFESVLKNNKGSNRGALFCSPIVNSEADKKLSDNQSSIQKFEVVITAPSTKTSTNDDWSNAALIVADGAPGKIAITLQGEYAGTTKHPLPSSTITKIRRSFNANLLSKAVATTTTGEEINLIQNRLRDIIRVDMTGKYPLAGSVLNEFITIFERRATELARYVSE
jgi:hypothetical protein